MARRCWNSLQRAGRIHATGPDGVHIVIDRGRLVAASQDASQLPLVEADPGIDRPSTVSIAEIEEAALIWRWLSGPQVELDDVTGSLACPSVQVPMLNRNGRA
ncbi:MAG: hypothetical protein ABFR53_08360, partial [Actinomycetota bacterium]